jgi:hypothetical protein
LQHEKSSQTRRKSTALIPPFQNSFDLEKSWPDGQAIAISARVLPTFLRWLSNHHFSTCHIVFLRVPAI